MEMHKVAAVIGPDITHIDRLFLRSKQKKA